MPAEAIQAVTGAFGYSGRYIARQLLDCGQRVRTLTNAPAYSNPFGGSIEVRPLSFDRPDVLTESLRGVEVLYNTYWVRFNHRRFNFASAIQNSRALFLAAKSAGVRRIVHVSITNPALDSPLEYFRGKAILERELAELGVSYTILRPAVLFGHEDILINNIAWSLRHFPVFGIPGDGAYRLQPIHVEDFARLAIAQGQKEGNIIINAIGPETFTYRKLVELLAGTIGCQRRLQSMPPGLVYLFGRLMGWFLGDVLVTRDELRGLMADLLYVDAPPLGTIKLSDWARAQASSLGLHYASELARRRPS